MANHALLVAILIFSGLAFDAVADERSIPVTVTIPAGIFIAGSDRAERDYGYRLDEKAYGHSVTRKQKWYEVELTRGPRHIKAFHITRSPITNRNFLAFVRATKHRYPTVNAKTWKAYGLIHPYARSRRHAWKNSQPPNGRLDHPVVMVSQGDARAYARWLSTVTGKRWRLPTELQWEKAARGRDGRYFPWGNRFQASRLNSHDGGPFDTLPVGKFLAGNSPFGLWDAAGQVFEWTATQNGQSRYIVKGGSWDDSGCGICRPAARHSRPQAIKHILIGFRLIHE
jgi:formylglycine-generating enzyme required for sulfatase activity